ncbi:sulfite exporter TauE/SafE family protein [Roseivivax isoporae]|uniref:Probable membrane transporter protein n=1 Tax=Roseivivax isoporae LMG 25204 TaxID=1449351 RepID=X7FC52_9RHOB|nr:sulfite exporter TauE/SafE family protein [Roseivivax isoporae]ETX30323.1 membrane protein [Roseivivax isoporae LMG 25204]
MTFDDLWLFLPLLLATGGFSGVISGLLGIGGGIFLVPVFLFVFTRFGVSDAVVMQLCVGTSTATVVATSLRSVLSHHKRGAVDVAALRLFAPWLSVGAVGGVIAATSMRSDTLMAVFGTIALVMGFYILAGNPRWRVAETLPRRRVAAPLGGFIGFVCAMMGIGGGTFGVPTLTAFGRSVHVAIATAAGFGLLVSLPAALAYLVRTPSAPVPPLTAGFVSLPAFAVTVIATFLTVPIGVRLAHVLPAQTLRRVFAAFIILAALNMLRKAFG